MVTPNTESFSLEIELPVKPERLYYAWLDSDLHTAFTGSEANMSSEVGAEFTAWDGYIEGRNLVLEPTYRIVQSWRTTEFSDEDDDSILELFFEHHAQGCIMKLRHSNIPKGQSKQYIEGWEEYYFIPMRAYFMEIFSIEEGNPNLQNL